MYHSSASLRANNVSDSKDGEGKDLNPVKSKFGHINKKHICRTTAEAQMVEHTSDKTHDQQYKVGTSIDGHDSLNVNEENASRSISEATPKQDEKYTEMNRGRTLEEIMAADIEERNRNVENMKDALDANEHGTEDKNGHSNEEVIIDDDLASLAVEGEDIQYMPLDSNNEPVDMTNIMTKYTNDEIGIYMREMSAPAVGRSIGGVTIWSTDLRESDLHEKHIRGGGRGGQKINKTSNCVQLTHLPTGIVIKCQATRSLESNRKIARKVLSNK